MLVHDRDDSGGLVKKGPLAEAQVVACLRANGFPAAERRVMGGRNDRGDVAGLPGVVIEVKNRAEMQLAQWVDEAGEEARCRCDDSSYLSCAGDELGAVWHKRRGKGDPLDWYVTMTGRDFLALLSEYCRDDRPNPVSGSFRLDDSARDVIRQAREKGLIGR